LFLGSQHDNIDDMIAKGRDGFNHGNRKYGDDHWTHRKPECVARGERNAATKLSPKDKRAMLADCVTGASSLREIGTRYGVTAQAVWYHLHRARSDVDRAIIGTPADGDRSR